MQQTLLVHIWYPVAADGFWHADMVVFTESQLNDTQYGLSIATCLLAGCTWLQPYATQESENKDLGYKMHVSWLTVRVSSRSINSVRDVSSCEVDPN